MRDLYKALGLASPSVDERAVRDAIERCPNADVARRARAVLLDPMRRRNYDVTLKQLHYIASLRANLGLSRTAAWTSTLTVGDFDHSPDGSGSRFESLKSRISRPKASISNEKRISWRGWFWVICIGFVCFAQWDSCSSKSSRSKANSGPNRRATTPAQGRSSPRNDFTAPLQKMPQTGQLSNALGLVAPLTVTTRDFSNAYYLKLVRPGLREPVMEYFIRPGQTLDALAPLGVYELRYAAGTSWYGETLLFGPETIYSRAETDLNFKKSFDGYSGYTIELYLQPQGNLQTERLSPGEF